MEVCRMNEYGREVAKKMESYMGNTDSVAEEISDIQNAQKGVEVRGALAAGVKKAFDKSKTAQIKSEEATEITQNLLDDSFDTSKINANFEQRLDTEIANLQPEWTGFKDDVTSQLAQTEKDITSRGVNLQSLGAVADGVTDVSDILIHALDAYRDVFIPPGFYGISKEIVLNNRRRVRGVGGSWSPSISSDTVFIWIGEDNPDAAMFRISHSPIGIEPTIAITNTYLENVVIDGNNKIGYGFYGAYVSDESRLKNITVKNTLKHAGRIEKSWYALYEDLTARNNKGCGFTFGKESWGECNSIKLHNVRAQSCGEDEKYGEGNLEWGYGVGLYNGYNLVIKGLTSERNIGVGLIHKNSKSISGIDGAYFENNERLSGKEKRRSILYLGNTTGRGHFLKNVYLRGERGETFRDGIEILGDPGTKLEMKNIYFGWLKSNSELYALENCYYGIRDYVEGHIGKKEGIYGYNLTTLYVRGNGKDSNDGRTPETAFATLQKAVEVAVFAERVNTIDCANIDIKEPLLDFKNFKKVMTINGNGNSQISNITNNKGLEIHNATRKVKINGFSKISRLIVNNSKIDIMNSTLSLSDSGADGVVTAKNSFLNFIDCRLNNGNTSHSLMSGLFLNGSAATLKQTTILGFTNGRYTRLENGSSITSDEWLPGFGSQYSDFRDSGWIMGGNKLRNRFGEITFS